MPSASVAREITTVTVGFGHEVQETAAIKARIGYDAGAFMPYATGGVAFGRLETTLFIGADAQSFENGSLVESASASAARTDEEYKVGYAVGGGVEVPLPNNFSLRTEYVYTDLGDIEYRVDDEFGGSASASFETRMHEARIGVSYRF